MRAEVSYALVIKVGKGVEGFVTYGSKLECGNPRASEMIYEGGSGQE